MEAQDDGLTVLQSRERIAGRYCIDVKLVVDIEREAVKVNWPPLDITFPDPTVHDTAPYESKRE